MTHFGQPNIHPLRRQPNGPWTVGEVCSRHGGVWRLSWSVTGDVLAVSDGNNEVTLWKEAVDHTWTQVA